MAITPLLTAIPVPGHTEGSVVYLFEGRFLFPGDSLYWSRGRRRLSAFRDACWYSWEEQKRSLARLTEYSFAWVLPGHGNRVPFPEQWQNQLLDFLRWMETGPHTSEW
jgi:glyoxylase-like metal-dependent hydrolase (beta-lactamase superfamily II)